MKDLMNRATADDISCVVDHRSRSKSPLIDRASPSGPKEKDIEIDNKRPESPVKDSKVCFPSVRVLVLVVTITQ